MNIDQISERFSQLRGILAQEVRRTTSNASTPESRRTTKAADKILRQCKKAMEQGLGSNEFKQWVRDCDYFLKNKKLRAEAKTGPRGRVTKGSADP